MAGGGATVWTDFLLGADGAVRFLLRDRGMKDAQRGRAVMRPLEIETYRMKALLPLPLAQREAPRIPAPQPGLAAMSARLVAVSAQSDHTPLRDTARLADAIPTLTFQPPHTLPPS